jgi:hypothetical protein
MSVIMTMRAAGDPAALERDAAEHPGEIKSISQRAQQAGAIAHRFYGAEGQIMVVDEWPDPDSFQRVFGSERANIEPIMAASGMTAEPEVTFWRKLETGDEIGWAD